MIKQRLENDLNDVVKNLAYQTTDILCSIPKNSSFGDYSTNIALQLAKQKSDNNKQSSQKIANEIVKKFRELESAKEYLEKLEVVGGFINFFLKKEALMKNLHQVCDYSYFVRPEVQVEGSFKGKKILVEYGHANTHKSFHIGHLRNIILGECLCRLLLSQNWQVFRANYQGDIGLHVAKALWGIEHSSDLISSKMDLSRKVAFLGKSYAKGATEFDRDENIKKEIYQINKNLYQKDSKIMKLWSQTRQWSLEYFDNIYQRMGVKFDRLYFESEVEGIGKEIVLDNLNKVFFEDQGAIIFKGGQSGLHNRVFITSEGNPTYEAKEIGLAKLEYEEAKYDHSIHVVDVTQSGYFQVVIKAIESIFENLKGKKQHLPYGFVDLQGKKMSSRTGDVVTFEFLYQAVRKRVAAVMKKVKFAEKEQIIDMITMGAIKFTMLKYTPQTKILFDIENSIALEGDSGPYVQYSYARAKSVLRAASYDYQPQIESGELEAMERQLLQKIEYFPSIVAQAAESYSPNLLASFLVDFAKSFNLFYQKHPIIKAEKSEFRLALTCAVAIVLKQGLDLLGIEAPERM